MFGRVIVTRAYPRVCFTQYRSFSTVQEQKSPRRWPLYTLGTLGLVGGLIYVVHTNGAVRHHIRQSLGEDTPVLKNVDMVADKAHLVGRHVSAGYHAVRQMFTTTPKPPAPAPIKIERPKRVTPISNDPTVARLFNTLDELIDSLDYVALTEEQRQLLQRAVRHLQETDRVIHSWASGDVGRLRRELEETTKNFSETVKQLREDNEQRLRAQEEELKSEWERERRALIVRYRNEIKKRMHQLRDDLTRRWQRDLRMHIEQEQVHRLGQLEQVQAELKELERILRDNAIILDRCVANNQLQIIATALRQALEAPTRTAFVEEWTALRRIVHQYPMLAPVVDSIKEEVAYRGVDTFLDLAERFQTVKEQVRRASMVPEDGGLISHAVSATMSKLLVEKQGNVAGDDVEAILARTEYRLGQFDLDGATRELNQLSGWPKRLAHDWIEAARRRLELLQALQVIETQSYLSALQMN